MAMRHGPLVDRSGRIMFLCSACGSPITRDDFLEMGLRLPDQSESRDDYCDAERIDSVMHVDCLRAARAG
jgi:hypothetical protein